MGTNYYWYPVVVDEDVDWLHRLANGQIASTHHRLHKVADRLDALLAQTEPHHIGKSSFGWQFSFQTCEEIDPPIRSWKAWQALLATGGVIKDEYEKVVTLEELKELVESKRGGMNHTDEVGSHDPYYGERGCFNDDEGHSFNPHEFS